MNRNRRRVEFSGSLPRRLFRRGQSTVELALSMVLVLPLLLLGGADFARVFFYTITLNSAARAGAQYGSQGNANAADTTGIKNAAVGDGSSIGLTTSGVSTSQCTCVAGTSVTLCTAAPFSMPSSYCTASKNSASFVLVTTTATYTTLVHYPGIPHSTPMTSTAIMQVEE